MRSFMDLIIFVKFGQVLALNVSVTTKYEAFLNKNKIE